MVFKWVLIVFAVAATALFVLSKALAFLNPPKPGRPKAVLLQRVERTLRWMVLLPLAIAVCLLAFALR
jgi:hypothetical protein